MDSPVRTSADVPATPKELNELVSGGSVFFDAPTRTWTFTRFEDIVSILRDNRLSKDPRVAAKETGAAYLIPLTEEGNMIWRDPPENTRLRRLVAPAFTPKFVETLRPRLVAATDRVLDEIPNESFDFSERVVRPLILHVVASVFIGVPEDELPTFRKWIPVLMGTLNPKVPREEVMQARVHMNEMWTRIIEARRAKPEDDFISLLVHADADRISLRETFEMLTSMFMAGNGASAETLNSLVWLLLDVPERWETLKRDRSLVTDIVEEGLRFEPGIPTIQRFVASDIELRNTLLKAGDKVLLHLSAAGRDPAANQEPGTFEIERPARKHCSFGNGPRICPGAPIFRAEAEVLLQRLLDRFPNLRMDRSKPVTRLTLPMLRGIESLWVLPS